MPLVRIAMESKETKQEGRNEGEKERKENKKKG
jgi:hypothetical protein